jgi:hypothetical protein
MPAWDNGKQMPRSALFGGKKTPISKLNSNAGDRHVFWLEDACAAEIAIYEICSGSA